MAVYRGVVRGGSVELPPDADLADGSVVEVRLVAPVPIDDGDDEADRRVQEALVAAGLLGRVRPLGARSAAGERPLLHVAGPPVSETVVAERR